MNKLIDSRSYTVIKKTYNILIFFAVFAASAFYWRGIFKFYFIGSDEWAVFISYAGSTDWESLLNNFFSPHMEHFMPVFKIFFFLEFYLFGLNPNNLMLDPFLIIKGAAIVVGELISKTLGIDLVLILINKYALPLLNISGLSQYLLIIYKFMSLLSLIVLICLSLLIFIRQDKQAKTTMLLGFLILSVSVASLIVKRSYYGLGFFQIADVQRYLYFPFIGLLIMTAPALVYWHKQKGRRMKIISAAVLVILIAIGQYGISRISLNYQYGGATGAEYEKFVNYLKNNIKHSHTRYIQIPENYHMLRIGHGNIQYMDLVALLKEDNDIVVEHEGKALLLKDYESIDHNKIMTEQKSDIILHNDSLEISVSNAVLSIPDGKPDFQTRFKHVFFRMKAGRPLKGRLYYYEDNLEKYSEFNISKSRAYKQYVIPCPYGKNMKLMLESGNLSIKDIRLYE